MKIECTSEIVLPRSIEEIRKAIADLPDDTVTTVRIERGDRPWEGEMAYIKFRWTEEK